LISMPYDIGSGGALAAADDGERALVDHAVELARQHRVDYLELRYGTERRALALAPLRKRMPVLISEMHLEGQDQVWARVEEDHRKAVRKARSRGITVVEARSADDDRALHGVYLRAFRD